MEEAKTKMVYKNGYVKDGRCFFDFVVNPNKTHDNIISNTDPDIINKTSNTYEFGIEIDSPEFEKFETLILNSDLWENVRRDDSKKYSELAKLLSEYFYPIEDGRIKF